MRPSADYYTALRVVEQSEPHKVNGAAKPDAGPDMLTGFDPEDVGNAQRVVKMHGERIRFCYEFKKWLVWDGRRWAVDDADRLRVLTHETLTEFAHQAVESKDEKLIHFAASSRRTARISNALREAEVLLPISQARLDQHPALLNFINGTVNLETGELLQHDPAKFITKLVHYAYNPAAECPLFLSVLRRAMGCTAEASEGDLERADRLVEFLQRAFGYSLTGHTSEKAVFLPWGPGDNSKTTLLATFLHLLKEYGVLLQVDTLMVRQESANTQSDLADLRGARFAVTSETEEGQRLAEGKLKRITQGMGRIKAVRKYENPIEFAETHKLWIDSNHLPTVRGTDNAIWNRLLPIPFSITIPKDEQDKTLLVKLLSEAEGILAWAVEGARLWFAGGLQRPKDVADAGQSWRDASDQLQRFLDDRCIKEEDAVVQARLLYTDYKRWAEDGGEHPESERRFADRMQERGYAKDKRSTGAFYLGLELRKGA